MTFNFEKGRLELFKTGYTQKQVDSINSILQAANEQGIALKTQLAYILGTAYHEAFDYTGNQTGKIQRLVPIYEVGSNQYLSKYDTGKLAKDLGNTPEVDGDGQLYKGRGFVQITGRRNYERFQNLTKLPLLKNPDLVLNTNTAAFVIVYGMKHGIFTGKKLDDYVTSKITNFVEARRIVNGKDKADLIASYANQFLKCIE